MLVPLLYPKRTALAKSPSQLVMHFPLASLSHLNSSCSHKLFVEYLTKAKIMASSKKNNVLDGIKKEEFKRCVFTHEYKAEVVRHKKAENLSATECGRKFDVLPKRVPPSEKQYEAGKLTQAAGRRSPHRESGTGRDHQTACKFRVTTDSAHSLPIAPHLLGQNFSCDTSAESTSHAKAPDQVWWSDITYLWTREGWLYVCAVLDLFIRRVGWAIEAHMTRDLVLDAMQMAYATRKPGPGLIFHSDRGCQYAGHEVRHGQLL